MSLNPVTIMDLARLLGLSKSTVSRALKNHPDISQTTRDAVQQLAESLNYRPNSVAVSLRHKKTKIIGLVVPQISYFFFPSVVKGIEDEVNKHGYTLMIMQSNEEYEREKAACNILMSGNVEGMLVSVSRQTVDFTHFEDIIRAGLPIVFFDRVPEGCRADMVLVDDTDGAYRATRHLIETGKRRIAICTGTPNLMISRNRLRGYKAALTEAGLAIDERYIFEGETPEEVEKGMGALLDMPERPDGIFAISDLTMAGIMRAIYAHQLKIPEQIGVIGFCEEPFSLMYNPQLSTIKPMGFEIGKAAAQLLFKKILNGQENLATERFEIPGDLLKRGSTI
ncbi:MAG: LacI family transcriptional regulator [Lentimicrobium sp.]|nr:LacI family transcriptional regulator [Lentimicrobium sp.]HPG34524.1 LacI family DNA-binding transcriptional regulator [Lentimicrobium sp.]